MPSANLSPVFIKTLEAYQSGDHLIIQQGGQGSSKTYSILQLIYLIAKKEKKRITIASYALPHLKQGAMADFEKILESFGENPGALKNVTESTYYIGNSSVEFFGIEGNVAKAHGPRRDILFINECNRKITYEIFDQLSSRTQGTVFLDFNPDQEFWLHEKVLPNFKHTLIKSNYLDNPWLPDNEVQNILMKKDKPGFENWWRVYGMGELGKLEGAIFMNWRYGEFDTSLPYGFGLDFGFNDPDAMVKVAVSHKLKIIYIDEKIYKSGNSAEQLKLLMDAYCNRNDMIVADCADARMIAQLRRYFNIRPTNKKKWTVAEAIKVMQDYEIVITEGSYNLAKELNNYIWNDKKAGIPIDGFDHLIDAGRYYFLESIRGGHQQWH
jgi:phage terminase large subunit